MIRDIIMLVKQSDEIAMMMLIEKFNPLLKCYARKLNYEDAYEDMLLFFIQLLITFNVDRLCTAEDGVIVSYINISVRNFYYKKISTLALQNKEIALSNLSEKQIYNIDSKWAKLDEYDFIMEMTIKEILNADEYEIIYKIFVRGYTSTEIANMTNKSKQAINQMKKRALSKIKKYID